MLGPLPLSWVVLLAFAPAGSGEGPQADVTVDLEASSEEAPPPETEADPESDPEIEPPIEPEVEPEAEPPTEPEIEPAAEPEAEPETEPETETEELLTLTPPSMVGPMEDDAEGEGIDDYDPLVDSPQARRAKGWVVSGATALAVGGVLGAGSVAMGLSDPCAPRGGNNCFKNARNRAALTMGIPAAVLVAGGAAMLTVGLLRRKKIRQEHASISLPMPALGRFGGVAVTGRF